MKSTAFVLFAFLAATTSAVAHASCGKDDPAAVRFAIAYLSSLDSGGIPYSGTPDIEGPTIDQLCADLVGWQLTLSQTAPGYTDIILRFSSQACTMPAKIADDGRVAASLPMSCK